jgi:hypothetical protein
LPSTIDLLDESRNQRIHARLNLRILPRITIGTKVLFTLTQPTIVPRKDFNSEVTVMVILLEPLLK